MINMREKISNMRNVKGKSDVGHFCARQFGLISPKDSWRKNARRPIYPSHFSCLIFFPPYLSFDSNYHDKISFKRLDFDLESVAWILKPKSLPAKIWHSLFFAEIGMLQGIQKE